MAPTGQNGKAKLRVLTPEGLEHIVAHKYQGGKYTPLDNFLNPFWLWVSEQLPMWLAPNLVTLSGFLPMVLSYILAWYQSPDFDQPAPRWLALLTCLSLFVYQTLDAVDGKQARRTGSSTPLGQLFDHGCDCMTCLSHHSVAGMLILPGPSKWGFFGLAALQTAFFMAQWQEYYTGVLRTSFGAVGVTEMQFSLILALLFAGVAGPERIHAWTHATVRVPWASEPQRMGIAAIQAWGVFCAVLMVISLGKTLTYLAHHKDGGVRKAAVALLDMVPVLALNVLLYSWEQSLVDREPRLLCFVTGLLFFYYSAQMIVFSMARMPYPVWQPTLVPYAVLVGLSRVAPAQWAWAVDLAVSVMAVAVAALVLQWLACVIQELTTRLGIHAFRLGPKAKAS